MPEVQATQQKHDTQRCEGNVRGIGVVYDGTKPEAMRRFNLFVVQSRNAKSESDRRSVTLFKNFEMIRPFISGSAMGALKDCSNRILGSAL